MLSEPRERPRANRFGCALALFIVGCFILSLIGGWVVSETVWGWVF